MTGNCYCVIIQKSKLFKGIQMTQINGLSSLIILIRSMDQRFKNDRNGQCHEPNYLESVNENITGNTF